MKNTSERNNSTKWTTSAVVLANVPVQDVAVPVYKRLTLFFVAANALLLAGQLLFQAFNWSDFLLLQWCGVTGVMVVYRFNDMIDHAKDFKFNAQHVLGNKLNLFVLLQMLFLLIPIAFRSFSPERIIVLLLICSLGVLYSVKFRFKDQYYRIKHLFLVKNILIGVLWGALVLVGADNFSDPQVLALFLFTTLQVMIGSIIRDIPDTEADRKDGVQTLPVMIGFRGTMTYLHLFNAVSLISAALLFPIGSVVFMLTIVVIWRMMLLFNVGQQPDKKWFTNTLNLFTCVIILLALLLKQAVYGY